jgi:hypothetical protein
MEIGKYMQICKWLMVLFIFFSKLSYADEILRPKIQANKLSDIVYEIKTKELLPYLAKVIVINNKDLKDMPHILSFYEGKTMAAKDDVVYVMGIKSAENTIFDIVRFGTELKDPITKEYLGSTVEIIATARLLNVDKVSQLQVIDSYREIQIGYSVMPSVNFDLPETLDVRYPKNAIQGSVLTVLNGLENKGRYDSVILNLGARDKLAVGDLLDIVKLNRGVVDSYNNHKDIEKLPANKFGEILVYKVYDKASLGIILNTEFPVQNFDTVMN